MLVSGLLVRAATPLRTLALPKVGGTLVADHTTGEAG